MARKLKPSGKILIGFIAVVLLFVVFKTTGLWDMIAPGKNVKESTIPVIDGVGVNALQGTEVLRLAHWTWNSHQAWSYASKGQTTKPDSIFAKNGITMDFRRVEEIPKQIAALTAFASALNDPSENPKAGVHFFTIMGDAAGWVLNDTNSSLKPTGYTAEIIGFSGFSSGEDKFMGLPAWKKNPQTARGGLVAGVAADGDWNIMIFWCAQNGIPFNADKKYYDPNALNFINTESYLKAAEVYIANKPVELIFKSAGKDYQGNDVKKGDKGLVKINGSVTWTPGDKNIADQLGGLVSIASTKEYSNQMPQYIVGIKQWNMKHKDLVVRMLASIFTAADEIHRADKGLKAGRISPKSAQDKRWLAAKYVREIFGSESADYWYKYYDVVPIKDSQGLTVEIGGSSVSNLPRNYKYFGLDGSTDVGEIVYNRFAKLAMHYYPDFMDGYPAWKSVFNPVYLQAVKQKYPELAASDAYLPTFTGSANASKQIGQLTYRIEFASGSAAFKAGANKVLSDALKQLVIAANSKVEIHGHTDTQGTSENNTLLSRKRGNAVYQWFKTKSGSSFPKNRVRVIAHGEDDPIVTDFANGNFIPDKMAQNRRVVIKIFSN